jgi:hypothetical protein
MGFVSRNRATEGRDVDEEPGFKSTSSDLPTPYNRYASATDSLLRAAPSLRLRDRDPTDGVPMMIADPPSAESTAIEAVAHPQTKYRWRRLVANRMANRIRRLRSSNYVLDGAIGVVFGVLTWPAASTPASTGVDPSWIVGLHIAARERLPFGSDIAFTFGPLGFLGFPQPYLGWTSALALVFVGAVHLSACATLFHLARQVSGRVSASVLVLVVAFAFPWIVGWALYGVLIFVASAGAVLRRTQQPTGLRFAVAVGAAVGFAGLGKLNIAAVSFGIAGLAVLATSRDWRESFLAFGVSAMSVFVGLWLVMGQAITDLPSYIRAALEISTGYSESMGMVDANSNWASGVAVLATTILAGMVWQRSANLPRRDRAVLWILFAVIVFASYKAGFTRAGAGMAIFLSTLLALWPVVSQRTSSWVTAYMPVAGLLAAFIAVMAIPVTSLMAPVARVKSLRAETATVLTGRGDGAAQTAAGLRAQYGLPPEALSLLDGRTVDIQPWESAVAYAFPEIIWRPEPVFQAYSAYTPYLDQLNASFLAGARAADRMLWLSPAGAALSIDYRNFWFDAPAAKVEMLCRYLPLASTPTWQVLGRVEDRCSAPVTVATVTARAGEPVRLPGNLPPGIVTVRVSGVGKDLLTRLATLAYETPPWYISEDLSKGRLPPGTASDPLVLGATTDVGYKEALALSAPPGSITVGPDAGAIGFGSPLSLEFQVIPIDRSS